VEVPLLLSRRILVKLISMFLTINSRPSSRLALEESNIP